MLIALLYLYYQTPDNHSFDIQALYTAGRSLPAFEQGVLFWGLFLAFAIKMPVFPFHTWQPDTYTVAPMEGTMLLSGIMLKMGFYGVIRWLLPVVPDQTNEVNGNERHFPENIKQESVERAKNADQSHLHEKHQAIKRRSTFVLMFERRKNDQWCQDSSQQNEEHADAVDARVEIDAEGFDPGVIYRELRAV